MKINSRGKGSTWELTQDLLSVGQFKEIVGQILNNGDSGKLDIGLNLCGIEIIKKSDPF